jgi:hypothetical protein
MVLRMVKLLAPFDCTVVASISGVLGVDTGSTGDNPLRDQFHEQVFPNVAELAALQTPA